MFVAAPLPPKPYPQGDYPASQGDGLASPGDEGCP
ncbi:hypothetical protein GKODMF_00745 [Candidatus Electrothrix gigas]